MSLWLRAKLNKFLTHAARYSYHINYKYISMITALAFLTESEQWANDRHTLSQGSSSPQRAFSTGKRMNPTSRWAPAPCRRNKPAGTKAARICAKSASSGQFIVSTILSLHEKAMPRIPFNNDATTLTVDFTPYDITIFRYFAHCNIFCNIVAHLFLYFCDRI